MMEKFGERFLGTPLNVWVVEANEWFWPSLEIFHFLGLCLLLGALIIIDLRMAGFFRSVSADAVHKLLPLVLIGFAINLITGVLFWYGDPMRYAVNIGFQIKMLLIVLAGINALVYQFKIAPVMHTWNESDPSPLLAKSVAYISLGAWTGVLLLGRLIPYVGTG